MGKKQTIKLIQKIKKTTDEKPRSQKTRAERREKRDGPKYETLLGRQKQAIKKRQREKALAKQLPTEPEKQPKKTAFDKEAGTAKGAGAAPKGKSAKDMSLDEFLAGGFEDMKGGSESDLSDASDIEEADAREQEPASASEEEEEDAASKESGDEEEDSDDDDDDGDSDVDETAQHMHDLEELKKKDPEFYKHLQSEGKELLAFGDDQDDDSSDGAEEKGNGDDVSDNDDDEEEEEEEEKQRTVVDMKAFRALEIQAFTELSPSAVKDVVALFKLAVRADKDESEQEDGGAREEPKFDIKNDSTRSTIIEACVDKLFPALDALIGLKRPDKSVIDAGRGVRLPKNIKAWSKFDSLVKRFLVDFLYALKSSRDAAYKTMLLRRAKPYMIYVVSSQSKVMRAYLKYLVEVWAGALATEPERLAAFTNIRLIALLAHGSLAEILKTVYLEFVRTAKSGNSHEQDRISFQAKCLVELFGINLSISYQLAFVYVRQLALHLRAAILSKTIESLQSVYSWQFVHCLRLWGSVLSAYPGEPVADNKTGQLTVEQQQLRSLIYPLCQVITGTIRLSPVSRYFPLRFHLVAVLNSLARASRNYVPVAHLLLDVFLDPIFQGFKPKQSTAKPPQLSVSLKLSKQALTSPLFQNVMISRTVKLIEQNFECYRFSIGFPELVFPVTTALRAFAKKTRVTQWRSESRSLISTLEKWADQVKAKRLKTDIGPAAVTELNEFMVEEDEKFRAAQDASHRKDLLKNKKRDVVSLDAEQEEASEDDDEAEDIADGTDGSDDEPEEARPAKLRKLETAKAKPAKKVKPPTRAELGDEEDVVEDMAMSDSDSE